MLHQGMVQADDCLWPAAGCMLHAYDIKERPRQAAHPAFITKSPCFAA